MRLNNTEGSMLYRLYGPNGSDLLVSEHEKRCYAMAKELERHGLVVLSPHANMPSIYEVKRVCRGLNKS